MAKDTKRNKKKKRVKQELPSGPWIKMRTGLVIIAITSVFMAVLTAWQAIPIKGLWEGILWGVLFGVFIWAIFFGLLLVNRFLGR